MLAEIGIVLGRLGASCVLIGISGCLAEAVKARRGARRRALWACAGVALFAAVLVCYRCLWIVAG